MIIVGEAALTVSGKRRAEFIIGSELLERRTLERAGCKMNWPVTVKSNIITITCDTAEQARELEPFISPIVKREHRNAMKDVPHEFVKGHIQHLYCDVCDNREDRPPHGETGL